MEDQIKILEERVDALETRLSNDLWQILLGDTVKVYIREHYPYAGSYDTDLYWRVLEEMKDKIRKILMED